MEHSESRTNQSIKKESCNCRVQRSRYPAGYNLEHDKPINAASSKPIPIKEPTTACEEETSNPSLLSRRTNIPAAAAFT